MNGFLCTYFGPPDQCQECGGYDPTGTGLCCHDCGESYADRQARASAAERARRDREDAFGRDVDRLRVEGHSYEQIDVLLAGMPT